MNRIVTEAIQIQLQAENFNREDGFTLRCTWQLVISLLKCSLNQEQTAQAKCNDLLTPPTNQRGRIPSCN